MVSTLDFEEEIIVKALQKEKTTCEKIQRFEGLWHMLGST